MVRVYLYDMLFFSECVSKSFHKSVRFYSNKHLIFCPRTIRFLEMGIGKLYTRLHWVPTLRSWCCHSCCVVGLHVFLYTFVSPDTISLSINYSGHEMFAEKTIQEWWNIRYFFFIAMPRQPARNEWLLRWKISLIAKYPRLYSEI